MFLNGIAMREHFPVLDAKGRKMISGLMMDSEEDIPIRLIMDMLDYAKSLVSNS